MARLVMLEIHAHGHDRVLTGMMTGNAMHSKRQAARKGHAGRQ